MNRNHEDMIRLAEAASPSQRPKFRPCQEASGPFSIFGQKTFKSGARGSDLDLRSGVRIVPEIPALVGDVDIRDVIGRKRNPVVAADFNDAAFADNHLVKRLAVLERDRNYLVPDARLWTFFQVTETPIGNRK